MEYEFSDVSLDVDSSSTSDFKSCDNSTSELDDSKIWDSDQMLIWVSYINKWILTLL